MPKLEDSAAQPLTSRTSGLLNRWSEQPRAAEPLGGNDEHDIRRQVCAATERQRDGNHSTGERQDRTHRSHSTDRKTLTTTTHAAGRTLPNIFVFERH
jgi:hypothetical protein